MREILSAMALTALASLSYAPRPWRWLNRIEYTSAPCRHVQLGATSLRQSPGAKASGRIALTPPPDELAQIDLTGPPMTPSSWRKAASLEARHLTPFSPTQAYIGVRPAENMREATLWLGDKNITRHLEPQAPWRAEIGAQNAQAILTAPDGVTLLSPLAAPAPKARRPALGVVALLIIGAAMLCGARLAADHSARETQITALETKLKLAREAALEARLSLASAETLEAAAQTLSANAPPLQALAALSKAAPTILHIDEAVLTMDRIEISAVSAHAAQTLSEIAQNNELQALGYARARFIGPIAKTPSGQERFRLQLSAGAP